MISLKSKGTQKILNYFFLNYNGKVYINEIAKLLDLDPKNTDRKLKELEKEGLLSSDFEGKQRYFTLNKTYPLLKEYKEIILKTLGIEKKLKDVFLNDDKLEEAYIFGSYAKGKMDANSDIDVLLIGDHSSMKTEGDIIKIQKETGREINTINFSVEEFRRKQKEPFLKNVFEEKYIKLK
jgi:predicted nucleotidyltransferase